MCATRLGFTGATCQSYCEQAVEMFVLNIMIILFGLIIFLSGLRLCRRTPTQPHQSSRYKCCCYKRTRMVCLISLTHVALFCAVAASLFFTIYGVLSLFITVGFAQFFRVVPSPDNTRLLRRSSQAHETAAYIILVIAECLGTVNIMVLPLIWM